MKKIFAVILTLAMIIGCSSYAFAADVESVKAVKGETVNVSGNVTIGGVEASEGAKVTVDGYVNSNNPEGVNATNGSEVTVGSNVNGENLGIYAAESSTVKVGGDVAGKTGGLQASNQSQVTVEGNVTTVGGWGVGASHRDTVVTVDGNVESGDTGVYAEKEASVTVGGDVKGDTGIETNGVRTVVIIKGNVYGDTQGIDAQDYSTVHVYGDVNGNISEDFSRVNVAGIVKGDIDAKKDEDHWVCVGQLDGNVNEGSEDAVLFFVAPSDYSLIEDSKSPKITMSGELLDDGWLRCGEKWFNFTKTMNEIKPGMGFTIKAASSKKQLSIDKTNLPDTVDVKEENGTIIITIKEGCEFKGGLQKLLLTLSDIIDPTSKKSSSGNSYTLFTGTTGNPVTNGRWTQNADGTWSYATTSKFTNTWGCIANPNDANSAAWYYFDRNGNMLTGWQKLYWNGAYRWYYFSQTKDSNEGKCQLGGITPDGYRVGADGAWIED